MGCGLQRRRLVGLEQAVRFVLERAASGDRNAPYAVPQIGPKHL
jgi:hypothetical protein